MKKKPGQFEQIAHAARRLKEHGQDILHGEFERFNAIGDRINNIMKRFKEPRNIKQLISADGKQRRG